jgi:PIN domain nuclease of toxin-antitoxin system
VRLLLDTQAFLWFIEGDPQLSNVARTAIQDSRNEKWVSIASAWEAAIKTSKGKLKLAQPVHLHYPSQLQLNGFSLLEIRWDHLAQLQVLPWHHKDPFDRLMIAQAIAEQMDIVGIDALFDAYSITRLW